LLQLFHYRLFLSSLFFLVQDLISNGIQISLEFNTSGFIERMPVSIFAMLNFLSYSMQGLIFDALLGIYED